MSASSRLAVATQGLRGGTGSGTIVPFTGETAILLNDELRTAAEDSTTVTTIEEQVIAVSDSPSVISVDGEHTVYTDDETTLNGDC